MTTSSRMSLSPHMGMGPYMSPTPHYNNPSVAANSNSRAVITEKHVDFHGGSISLFVNSQQEIIGQERCINGKIEITISDITFVRGIWVRLQGITTVQDSSSKKFSNNHIFTETLLTNEEDFFVDGIYRIFIGFGKHDIDHDQLVQLHSGTYTWPFMFTIHSDSHPLSYCDQFVRTEYNILAQVDCPNIKLQQSQVLHYINISSYSYDSIESISNSPRHKPNNVLGQDEICARKKPSKISNFWTSLSCIPPRDEILARLEADEAARFPFEFANFNFPIRAYIASTRSHNEVLSLTATAALVVEVTARTDISLPFPEKNTSKTTYRKAFRLWEKAETVTIENEQETMVEFTVPISINPYIRKGMLEDWPEPLTIPHHEYPSILNWSETGKYHQYRVFARVLITNNRSKKSYCRPLIANIHIEPPCEQRMVDSPFAIHNRSMVGMQFTPQATMAQPKVVAEFVSLGPAAVLQDRNACAVRPNLSPSRFSTMHEVRMVETAAVGTPQYSPVLALIYNTFTPRRDSSSRKSSLSTSFRTNQLITPIIHATPVVESNNSSNATPSTAPSSDQGHFSESDGQSNRSQGREVVPANNAVNFTTGPTRLDFTSEGFSDSQDTRSEPSPTVPDPGVSFDIPSRTNLDEDLEIATDIVYANNAQLSYRQSFRNPSLGGSQNTSSRFALFRLPSVNAYSFEEFLEILREFDAAIRTSSASQGGSKHPIAISTDPDRTDSHSIAGKPIWSKKMEYIENAAMEMLLPRMTASQWLILRKEVEAAPIKDIIQMIRCTINYVEDRVELIHLLDEDSLFENYEAYQLIAST